jgi:transcription elongation factor Elf1
MSSHGSKVHCPSCGKPHVVQVGEIKAQRQIEFVCSRCALAISIAADAVVAVSDTNPAKPDKPAKFEIKLVE